MTTPVRPSAPGPVAGHFRPLPPTGPAARFSELLKQRKPAELPPEPDDLAVIPDEVLPLPPATSAAPREDEADPAEEADTRVFEPVPTAVAAAPSLLTDAHCRAAMREVALTIAGFCNDRAVNNGDLWQVQMALRADVVPDTTLHLSLSPHWLTLRFHTGDAAALDLLSRGREALLQILETTLARKRDIAITFESP